MRHTDHRLFPNASHRPSPLHTTTTFPLPTHNAPCLSNLSSFLLPSIPGRRPYLSRRQLWRSTPQSPLLPLRSNHRCTPLISSPTHDAGGSRVVVIVGKMWSGMPHRYQNRLDPLWVDTAVIFNPDLSSPHASCYHRPPYGGRCMDISLVVVP